MSKTKIPYPSAGGSYEHRDGTLHRTEAEPATAHAPKAAPAPAAPKKTASAPKPAARKTPKTKR